MLSTTPESKVNTTTEESKFITFHLGGYLFALPSQDVLKIVVTPVPEQGGMVNMGLVQLGQYSIQVLELQSLLKLEHPAGDREISDPTFLIILRAEQGLWGIVVNQSPDLMNLSNSTLKPVPTSKRIAGALKGISHIVTYESDADESAPADSAQSNPPTDDSTSPESRQILLVLDFHKLLAISQEDGKEQKTSSDHSLTLSPLTSTKANTKTATSQ